jgi:UDP:flavonoid glycosyltransferase YjiC (YdhE family)
MRITILAIGSRGDIQPCIALGVGLRQAGYEVRLAAPNNFESVATSCGLDFFSIGPDSQELMAENIGRKMMTTGNNGSAFLHALAKLVSTHSRESLAASLNACEGTNAILYNSFALMGAHVAEALNLPSAGAWIYPLNRTVEYPSIDTHPLLRFGGAFNWFTHLAGEQMIQHAFRNIFREWRQMLDLPPLPVTGFYDHLYRRRSPQLYGYSQYIVPKPQDWPDRFAVTGYWFLDHDENFLPPEELSHFIEAGPAPVYIGFGSVVGKDPVRLTEIVLRAARQSKQRIILAKGWGGLHLAETTRQVDENIFVVENIPHGWLFPRMKAVIHHGGAGTTAAALRAGVPSVIIPFSGDQPFWGDRVWKLGIGTAPIHHTQLNTQRLTAAIASITGNDDIQKRAHAIGEKIRSENGVARAVEAFQRFVING